MAKNLSRVFQFNYSLKYNEVTKHTTELGYFHDMQLMVVAPNVKEALDLLKLWHDDGTPEGVRFSDLGRCVDSTSIAVPKPS